MHIEIQWSHRFHLQHYEDIRTPPIAVPEQRSRKLKYRPGHIWTGHHRSPVATSCCLLYPILPLCGQELHHHRC